VLPNYHQPRSRTRKSTTPEPWSGTGWAVITGASSGLGMFFAEQLAKRGMSLVLAGRDQPRLTAVRQQVHQIAPRIDVELVVGDLGTESGIAALVAHLDGG
jgi:short-subunit dehydrogenase